MSSISSPSIISTITSPIQNNLPSQVTQSESPPFSTLSYIHSPCDRLVTPYIEAGYLDQQGLINRELLKDLRVPFDPSETLMELINGFNYNSPHPSVQLLKNYITNYAGPQPRLQVTLIGEQTIAYLHGVGGYESALEKLQKVPIPQKLPESVHAYLSSKPHVYTIHYSCSHNFIYKQFETMLNFFAKQPNSKCCPLQWKYKKSEQLNIKMDFTPMFTGHSLPKIKADADWQLLFDTLGEQISYGEIQHQSIDSWPILTLRRLMGRMIRTTGENQKCLDHFLQITIKKVGTEKGAEILKHAFSSAFGNHPAAAAALLFNLTLDFQRSGYYQSNGLILDSLHKHLPCYSTPPAQVVGHRDTCLALIQKLLKNKDAFKCTQAYLQLAPLWSLLFKDLDEQDPYTLVTHLRPDNGQPTWRMRFGGASQEPIALWQPCDWLGLLQHLDKLEGYLRNHPEVDQDLHELYFHVQPPLETTLSSEPALLSHHLPLFQLSPSKLRTLAHRLIHSQTSSLKLLGQTLCFSLYLAYQERYDLDLFLLNFGSFYAAFEAKGKGGASLQWLQQIAPHVSAFSLLTQELQPFSPHQNWIVALAKSPNRIDVEIALELLKREQSPEVFTNCFPPIFAQHPDLVCRLLRISFPHLPIQDCMKYLEILRLAPSSFQSLFAPQLFNLVQDTLIRVFEEGIAKAKYN